MKRKYPWLNKKSRIFLKNGYLSNKETPEERIEVIAKTAEKLLNKEGYADKFLEYTEKGWFLFSSPVWANFGKERGLPIACFSSYLEDTMDSILFTAAEVGKMTQKGGGTSGYFGEIRPRGSEISSGGKSDGSTSFMRIFDTIVDTCKQSSVRRGVMAAYLPVDHGDIDEFLKIRHEGSPIQNLFTGVTVKDRWLKSMINGDKKKRDIWGKVLRSRSLVGVPYIFFHDNVNKNAPKVYKDKGLTIHGSNLCVAPETLILTDEGYIRISQLENQMVNVFNGKEYSSVVVKKTGENQKLIRIVLESGRFIECTEYHKFYVDQNDWSISSEGRKPSTLVETRAKDLKKGDLIHVVSLKDDGAHTLKSLDSVLSVEDEGRFDDTYCVNEPKEHKVVFNGILTGNCSEICLSTDKDESFVCCLSSMNLLHYDEWKDTDAVEVLAYFLDAVIQEFINKADGIKHLERAVKFAKNQRAIGIGATGYHSLLQSKMIPFESLEAQMLNVEIFETINKQSLEASRKAAKEYGEPPLLKGYGERWAARMAVAPNTSSAFILGQVSQSVEPYKSNYYVKDLAKFKATIKNQYLEKLLEEKGKNTEEVWASILRNNGSVQQLDFLSEKEKAVFRTYPEISQKEIVTQAAQRQKYIDQSQSLNLTIPPETTPKEINELVLYAWESGIKTLYYQHSTNAAQAFYRKLNECTSCEG